MSVKESRASVPLIVPLVIVSIILLSFCYLIVAAVCAYIFAGNVPVSELDMGQSSWLAWTFYNYPGPGPLLPIILLALTVMHLAVGNAARALIIGVIAVFAFASTSQSIVFRYAALNGHAKIGCYVYESRECLAMLGVDDPAAPSMYQQPVQDNGHQHWAPWYQEARHGTPTPVVLPLVSPALLILSAPLNMDRAEELKAMLGAQRAEVAAVRAKHAKPE